METFLCLLWMCFIIECFRYLIIRISVFDHEYQGKYDAVGHALFYLDNITPNNDGAQSVKLYKHSWVSVFTIRIGYTII